MNQEELGGTTGIKTRPFDIIVPAHNHFELTARCIKTLYQNTLFPFHLIVVDDSTDLTPLYIGQLQKERDNITYIHWDTPFKNGNQFFNEALKSCKYDFVATVMNSVMVEPEWEIVALEVLRGHPKVGTIGLKCLFPPELTYGGTIESAGIELRGHIPIDIGAHFPAHRLSAVYERQAVQWAFAIHRREALIGNLDEDVYNGFVGWDDIDNCFVLKKKGWMIMYCGAGAGYHTPRATRGDDSKEASKKNEENAHIFFKRCGLWDLFVKRTGYKEPESLIPVTPNRAERRRMEREKQLVH